MFVPSQYSPTPSASQSVRLYASASTAPTYSAGDDDDGAAATMATVSETVHDHLYCNVEDFNCLRPCFAGDAQFYQHLNNIRTRHMCLYTNDPITTSRLRTIMATTTDSLPSVRATAWKMSASKKNGPAKSLFSQEQSTAICQFSDRHSLTTKKANSGYLQRLLLKLGIE